MTVEKNSGREILKTAILIYVKGLVQGVGFRPFVYKTAVKYQIKGWVENRNDCVKIKAEGNKTDIDNFISSLKKELPAAAIINSIKTEKSDIENFEDFRIIASKNVSDDITLISPDIAVCNDCLNDMKSQKHRLDYPFINCTNCGPRFTIIKDLPYDREQTTMQEFIMCDQCKSEYTDVLNRRFHAQPVACNKCGPVYELIVKNEGIKNEGIKNFKEIIEKVVEIIEKGKILAIKGIGGFHLACDATNDIAVESLRKLKIREGKPFAVMFSDINNLKEYAEINEVEEKLLLSWKRPIVILKIKENSKISYSISTGLDTIGVMLPYMPVHHLIFEKLKTPSIVLTSGNLADEPIVTDNQKAIEQFSEITDGVLIYNRDIYNRTDDSVVTIINNRERLFRRSRAYAPSPIDLDFSVDGIIATGAELQNCFCVGKGNQAFLSQHIGDLKNIETYEFYTETFKKFIKLFRVTPTLVGIDMHPDYLSTKYGESLPVIKTYIQHHHAHVASCMAEYGLDEKVIGISFDGTGYGDDSNIWGSEFLVCDLNEYERFSHFEYIPLPGGDKVTKEPWRTAVSYLYKVFGENFREMNFKFIEKIRKDDIDLLLNAINKKINSPLSSGAGRLFDAVSAMINICPVSSYHAEAPMRLESIINMNCSEKYNYEINSNISFNQTIKEIVEDINNNKNTGIISAKFHNTIVSVISEIADSIRNKYGINKIVISGGTFQNRYILSNVEKQLLSKDFKVFIPYKVPCNDGGIALGQLAVAAKRRELKIIG